MKRTLLIVLVPALLATPAAASEPTADQVKFFETKVRPLLVERCHKCHGAQKQQGGLRLDSRATILIGGDTGPAIMPGKPKESLLLRAVNQEEDGPKMPPKEKLKVEEIAVLTEWVTMGAPWPAAAAATTGIDFEAARKTYWAFQPVREPRLPAVKNVAWTRNDLDRFILSKLEEKGLTPVEPAAKLTLLRRVTFDLTGLPPTPEEIEAFRADDSSQAIIRVVDRLLASSAYGERWGRHWLDLVRYADTAGDNSDYPVPQLYKYRNWVLRAFARDMPYDQFLREQVAGDLLPAANEQDRYDKLIATGYLASAKRIGSVLEGYPWHLTVEDTIDNLGRTVLGLTVNCARCHDHKFDPISAEDYYALYGFFENTRYPWPGIELEKGQRDFVPLVPPEQAEAVLKERQQRQAAFDVEIKRLEQERVAAEKALKEAEALPLGDERAYRVAVAKTRADEVKKALETARKGKERLAQVPLPFETAYAVVDKAKAVNVHVQLKGNPEKPGKEVPRRFLTVLGGRQLPAEEKGSGRLALANWLTDAQNPLTARVMVNRIWQHHFGRGLAPTPSDFGKQGKPPSHPDLLDYLARRFVESGWSIKAMHRLIVLSRTYQLASRDDAANARTDPDNVYRWRFDRQRLDAESIRDALLSISGTLDRSAGGPHPFPEMPKWDFTQHKPFKAVYDTKRRSVYLMTQRIQRHPYLALFDGPDTNASTAFRVTSTTPLQALYLMNDAFVHEQAKRLAARLLSERPDDGSRIERAYLLAFGRPATDEEQAAGEEYLARVRGKLEADGVLSGQRTAAAWESYCRAMLMSNEFVYVN